MIDKDLAAFLQEGVGIHIATRNAALRPNGTRALAVTVEADGLHVVVYVAEAAAARILPDLEANGQVAVGFGRPIDDRACQVKGRVHRRAGRDRGRAAGGLRAVGSLSRRASSRSAFLARRRGRG